MRGGRRIQIPLLVGHHRPASETPFNQPSDNFRKVRCNFLQALMQNIEERFQDTDVIESMSVLDLQEQEDIPTFFGDLEMQTLADYFGLEEETLNL